MKLRQLLTALVAAAGFLGSGASHADLLQLRITEGANVFTIADNQVSGTACLNDNIGTVGTIQVNCATGNFTTTVTTGIGDTANPGDELDLNSIVVSSIGGGVLTLQLTERFITGIGDLVSWVGGIGGTTRGTVEWFVYIDDDSFFGQDFLVDSGSATSPTGTIIAFADLLGGTVGPILDSGPLYAATLFARVTHTGAQTSSFDFNMAVPEPATAALVGLALLGLGLTGRKRNS